MNPLDILGALSGVVNKVLDFIPDPVAKAKAQADAQAQLLAFVQSQNTAQAEVNKTEAASESIFVAGARPFILWVCGAGIAWTYVAGPLVSDVVRIWVPAYAPTVLDSGTLMGLVTSMLGLSGIRSFEKVQVAKR